MIFANIFDVMSDTYELDEAKNLIYAENGITQDQLDVWKDTNFGEGSSFNVMGSSIDMSEAQINMGENAFIKILGSGASQQGINLGGNIDVSGTLKISNSAGLYVDHIPYDNASTCNITLPYNCTKGIGFLTIEGNIPQKDVIISQIISTDNIDFEVNLSVVIFYPRSSNSLEMHISESGTSFSISAPDTALVWLAWTPRAL